MITSCAPSSFPTVEVEGPIENVETESLASKNGTQGSKLLEGRATMNHHFGSYYKQHSKATITQNII